MVTMVSSCLVTIAYWMLPLLLLLLLPFRLRMLPVVGGNVLGDGQDVAPLATDGIPPRNGEGAEGYGCCTRPQHGG